MRTDEAMRQAVNAVPTSCRLCGDPLVVAIHKDRGPLRSKYLAAIEFQEEDDAYWRAQTRLDTGAP